MSPLQVLAMIFTTTMAPGKEREKKDSKEPKYDLSLYKRGDLLEVPRTLFTHFGIYLGDGRVAHLIPDILPFVGASQKSIAAMVTNMRLILGVIVKAASVRVDSLEDFAYGSEILVNHTDNLCCQAPRTQEEVGRRAEQLVGPVIYSLLWYNCEHYVFDCRYGLCISYQTTQFCTAVRKLFLNRTNAYLAAVFALGLALFLGNNTTLSLLTSILIPFLIWMAS